MNSALPATISLIASGVLHGLLFFGLVRSASGAERAWDELEPARFVGNTFEIETVDTPASAVKTAAPPSAPAPEVSEPAPSPKPPTRDPPRLVEPVPPPVATPPEPAEGAPAPVTLPVAPSPAHRAPATHVPRPAASTNRPAPAPEAPPARQAGEVAPSAGSGSAAPSYGQDALAQSTASFAKAFTRAVPRIASADRVWHGLPLGAAGSAVFSIEVDAQGKVIGQGTVLDEPAPAAHLERIIARTILLLRNQTFGVTADAAAPTSQRLELSAEIRQVAALEDTFAAPQDLRQIGRLVEPTRVRPGKANFTYNSGRQVELTIRLLNP